MLNVPITAKSEQNTWRVLSYFQQNYTKTSNIKKLETSFHASDRLLFINNV